MGGSEAGVGDDRVLPATRVLSAAIVPFLVVAFVVLYGFPRNTGDLFAWTIKPTMTPMMLGGVYLGGAYFFVRAFRASQWHTVKAGFVAVATFASLMGVATILHWDRFNHGHVAFWLWAGLYFTTPFLVTAAWWANSRTESHVPHDDDLLLPAAVRLVIGVLGGAAVATGSFLFLLPAQALEIWPWMLSPLTSRVLGAVFMLGLAGVGVFVDRRWSTARLMLQVAALMMMLILVAAVRARAEFDASNPLSWIVLGGFAATFAGAAGLSLTMDARMRSQAQP